ncbi:MAG: hypothetical protein BWY78_01372 [Alphaproteobacteria bacterium ADurb.Bin438]|nr:MAG: hypothetical protein BWY78_01372 [Alphaproteobacteria bacterium ADurb.Bin438]
MIDPTKLDRVRTVLETDSGTKISDTLQEKDPKTLFPLQAALGYDIAQNLFIAKNNLIVEGLADLVYLTCISSLLETKGKTCLNKNITITPVGGLDKVVTFVALLNASELKLVCLLDTFNSEKGKQRLDELVKDKVIKSDHVKFYHEYTDIKKADLEDVFTKSEYLSLFNKAFPDRPLKEADLNKSIDSILIQIQKATKNDRFNHYLPAQALTKIVAEDRDVLSDKTLGRFEALFADINKLFGYK